MNMNWNVGRRDVGREVLTPNQPSSRLSTKTNQANYSGYFSHEKPDYWLQPFQVVDGIDEFVAIRERRYCPLDYSGNSAIATGEFYSADQHRYWMGFESGDTRILCGGQDYLETYPEWTASQYVEPYPVSGIPRLSIDHPPRPTPVHTKLYAQEQADAAFENVFNVSSCFSFAKKAEEVIAQNPGERAATLSGLTTIWTSIQSDIGELLGVQTETVDHSELLECVSERIASAYEWSVGLKPEMTNEECNSTGWDMTKMFLLYHHIPDFITAYEESLAAENGVALEAAVERRKTNRPMQLVADAHDRPDHHLFKPGFMKDSERPLFELSKAAHDVIHALDKDLKAITSDDVRPVWRDRTQMKNIHYVLVNFNNDVLKP
ncbi:hypothetical protein BDV96DRAFT_598366 [Lophiotrema nucula]|uniref:Uncharacterized protein n=1 Tax=Lophiotrema nucula TaxID=690887 RepID=A0A6A5ZD95_9PLEO|nr:hypothetical protein BDV96DRAFT_598366 [Lophiotrema nucula]